MEENRKILTGEDEKITKKIGNRIAQIRKNKGMTQFELAQQLNIDQSMICSYEQGRRRIPLLQFIKISKAIDVPPGILLNGMEDVRKANNIQISRRFSKRIEELEKLPEAEKKAIVKTIDALLLQYKMKLIEVQAQK